MNYKETLMMPSSFSSVTDEEMEYLDGGKPKDLPMNPAYLSRIVCTKTAESLRAEGYCCNMSTLDVAKEIFGHACAAYYGTALAITVPGASSFLLEIASHGWNGISLGDDKDPKWASAYDACWYFAPGVL